MEPDRKIFRISRKFHLRPGRGFFFGTMAQHHCTGNGCRPGTECIGGIAENAARLLQRLKQMFPDEKDPFVRIAGSKTLCGTETLFHFLYDSGGVDFIPHLLFRGPFGHRAQGGVDLFPDDLQETLFQQIIESPHGGSPFAEHEMVMFFQELIHIGVIIPGNLAKCIKIQISIEEGIFRGSAVIGSENQIFAVLIEFPHCTGTHFRQHLFFIPGTVFVTVCPDPGAVFEFSVPGFQQSIIFPVIPAPGSHDCRHDQYIIRQIHLRNLIIGGVGHLGDISFDPLFFQPRTDSGSHPENQFGNLLTGFFIPLIGACAFGNQFLTFVTATHIKPVMRHHGNNGSPGGGIHVPVFAFESPCIGTLPGKIRFHILINFLCDSAGKTKMGGMLQGRIVVPFAIGHQGKIFRIFEAVAITEGGKAVSGGNSGRIQTVPHPLEIFPGHTVIFPVFLFIPDSGIGIFAVKTHLEVRPLGNIDFFRQRKTGKRLGNRSHLPGKIEPHRTEPFQKIIHSGNRPPVKPHAPDIFGRIMDFGIQSGKIDKVSLSADKVPVPDQFSDPDPRFPGKGIIPQDQGNPLSGRLGNHRNLFPGDFPQIGA